VKIAPPLSSTLHIAPAAVHADATVHASSNGIASVVIPTEILKTHLLLSTIIYFFLPSPALVELPLCIDVAVCFSSSSTGSSRDVNVLE